MTTAPDTTTFACTPRPNRGSSLVVAGTFIVAITIMVVGSLQAFTNTRVAYNGFEARADLMYAAIGFVHAVKADLAAGNVDSFAAYRFTTSISEVASGYPVEASYGGGPVESTIYCYYQMNGDFAAGQTITSYAQRAYNGNLLTVAVSVQVEYTTNHLVFNYGAFGANGVSINNGSVDSYDGSLGVYDPLLPNSNGDIGSNGDIALSTFAVVNGSASVTSSGSITNGGTITGQQITDAPAAQFPAVELPACASDPAISGAFGAGTVNIPSGEWHYGVTTTSGAGTTINVTGPATVVFDSFTLAKDCVLNLDTSGGEIVVIVLGDCTLAAQSSVVTTSGLPKDFTFILMADTSNGDTVQLSAGSGIIGRLYAPNADITYSAGAAITGQVVAKSVTLSAGSEIHFDETMKTDLFAYVADPTDTPAEFISESWTVDSDPVVP